MTTTQQEREAFEVVWRNLDEMDMEATAWAIWQAARATLPQSEPVAEGKAEPDAWRYQAVGGGKDFRYRGKRKGFDLDYQILKPEPLYTAATLRQAVKSARREALEEAAKYAPIEVDGDCWFEGRIVADWKRMAVIGAEAIPDAVRWRERGEPVLLGHAFAYLRHGTQHTWGFEPAKAAWDIPKSDEARSRHIESHFPVYTAPPERSDVQGADECPYCGKPSIKCKCWGEILAYRIEERAGRYTFCEAKHWEGNRHLHEGANITPLAASRPAVQQEGLVLVPVEPTVEMVDEGYEALDRRDEPRAIYKAMIAAAPHAAACAKDDK